MEGNVKEIKTLIAQTMSFEILPVKIKPGVFEYFEVLYLAGITYSVVQFLGI